MQQLRRCVCAEGQRVQKCGGGKFIIERHNRKTTLHARVSSAAAPAPQACKHVTNTTPISLITAAV